MSLGNVFHLTHHLTRTISRSCRPPDNCRREHIEAPDISRTCRIFGISQSSQRHHIPSRRLYKEHIDIVFMCPVRSFGLNIYLINPVKHIEIVHINRSGVGFHRRKNIGHRDTQEFGFVPVDIKIQLRNFGL